eukprot:1188679-Prorocentrum_minimum.AAC.1
MYRIVLAGSQPASRPASAHPASRRKEPELEFLGRWFRTTTATPLPPRVGGPWDLIDRAKEVPRGSFLGHDTHAPSRACGQLHITS